MAARDRLSRQRRKRLRRPTGRTPTEGGLGSSFDDQFAGSLDGSAGNLNWLFPGVTAGKVNQYIQLNGVNATLAQFGNNIVIGSPASFPQTGVGTGAPRGGYGLNLIWGDTQANFTQPAIGQIGSLTVKMAGITYTASN